MADVKISQLPVATTPLTGTEVLPIVQSATTKQVSIANVTDGRALSALSLTLTNALTPANGGTGSSTTFTAGSVVFAGTSGIYTQRNANFFWDNTNYRLGIGTTSPGVSLSVGGTDAVKVPVGTTGERPTGAQGYIRFNSTNVTFEGYNGTTWTSVGGGATGGQSDQIFFLNGQTVNYDYTVASTNNAGSFGPITIAAGVTVTVSSGAVWTVV
jgi:hypothetical protein